MTLTKADLSKLSKLVSLAIKTLATDPLRLEMRAVETRLNKKMDKGFKKLDKKLDYQITHLDGHFTKRINDLETQISSALPA